MCKNIDCPLYGGACDAKTMEGFVICGEKASTAKPAADKEHKELRVELPIGTLIAYDTGNPEYPGIAIDLETKGANSERIGVANLEWGEDTNDGKRKLFAALFRKKAVDDCTDYIPFFE